MGTEIQVTDGFNRLKQNDISILLADGASCFKDESFDLVLFNPPYLPSEQIIDFAVDGGKGGFEVATHFLTQAQQVLRPKGRILIVLSSETSQTDFLLFCEENRLTAKQVFSKNLFFETLTVYELQKIDK